MPSTLTAVDVSGSCTERGTEPSAPWWKTTSTPRTAVWTRSYERRSPSTTSISRPSDARFAPAPGREVVEHSDVVAALQQRATRFEPMKPAPPVTSTRVMRADPRRRGSSRRACPGRLVAQRPELPVERARPQPIERGRRGRPRDRPERGPPQDVFEVERVQHREGGGRAGAGGHGNRCPVAVLRNRRSSPARVQRQRSTGFGW